MVWGSRPRASAVAEAVQPWANSQMACQRSLSRGVGARISRRCKSLASICHCCRNLSISLTPITNPSPTPGQASLLPSQIYPIPLHVSPWLWFRSHKWAFRMSRHNWSTCSFFHLYRLWGGLIWNRRPVFSMNSSDGGIASSLIRTGSGMIDSLPPSEPFSCSTTTQPHFALTTTITLLNFRDNTHTLFSPSISVNVLSRVNYICRLASIRWSITSLAGPRASVWASNW